MALTASPKDQARLLELQAIDTKITQLDHRARALPEHSIVLALAKEADALRGERLEAGGVVDDAKLELSRIESDVAVVEARIKRDVERVQSSSSVKDVAGLESELLGLRKRLSDLEEIELTVMERLESLESALNIVVAALTEAEGKMGAATVERDAALGALVTERAHAVADRATIASALPADLVALYERQRDRYGLGASLLQHGMSKASGVMLNEHDMQLIRAAAPDEVLLCPDSSAILVRTTDSGL